MSGPGAGVIAGLLLVMLGGGLLSGLLPLVNAEAILVAAVLGADDVWLGLAASLSVGQTCAKVLIFLASRNGLDHIRRKGVPAWAVRRVSTERRQRMAARRVPGGERLLALLGRPLPGSAVVATSAVVGIPPLAVTSVAAGVARLPLAVFCSTCLAGRFVRFTLIALPTARLAQATG